MRKAIFIDRDGVINCDTGHYYIWKAEEFRLNPGVSETLAGLRGRGYMIIVITNQGGIGRGEFTARDVDSLHDHMNRLLEEKGAAPDEVYYCPHHDSLEACLCRKPLPLMLEKAMARFGIDPELSWFIGDSLRDMEAGKAAGVGTILVESNGNLAGVLDRIP